MYTTSSSSSASSSTSLYGDGGRNLNFLGALAIKKCLVFKFKQLYLNLNKKT
jgi:hypothetical protein